MNIEFTQEGNMWVGTIEATGDFNLHMEKEGNGSVLFYQSGVADGAADKINGLKFTKEDTVLDVDVTALVYPKYITIKALEKPTVAVVTFAE